MAQPEITLLRETKPEVVFLCGQQVYNLATGKSVEVRIKTPNETVLDVEVPAGKHWKVTLSLNVIETDA